MNHITNIKLSNVRSHTLGAFEFDTDINAIVGPNGSGKTTLLEAIYVLLRGSSFKGTVIEMMQYASSDFRAELTTHTPSTSHSRSIGIQTVDHTTLKRWKIDNKSYARLPVSARLPVVLFEPDLARLISGGPERRRNYIDQLTAQLDISVAVAQSRYDRTLKQRNQLLKQLRESHTQVTPDKLFIWNTQLAQLAEIMVTARCKVISTLQDHITTYYNDLGGTDDVLLTYQSPVSNDSGLYASKLLHFYEASLTKDLVLGYTSFGPHRDDIEIRLSDQPAVERASRGEIRTVVIALKLLETKLLSDHYRSQHLKPVLLLDDVLSELDLVHQDRVLAGFKDHQVFLTTTDAHALTPSVHTIALELR